MFLMMRTFRYNTGWDCFVCLSFGGFLLLVFFFWFFIWAVGLGNGVQKVNRDDSISRSGFDFTLLYVWSGLCFFSLVTFRMKDGVGRGCFLSL